MADNIIKDNKINSDTSQGLRDLKVLEAIEEDPNISQRDLSNRLGVALGITNSLIKTLVRKGHIKVKGKNNRTLTYHLTHAGVLHKSKLAFQWTLNTIGEYRRLRALIEQRLKGLASEGIEKVIIYGANEIAEIAIVVSYDLSIEVLGVADSNSNHLKVAGLELSDFSELLNENADALINCVGSDFDREDEISSNVPGLKVFDLF